MAAADYLRPGLPLSSNNETTIQLLTHHNNCYNCSSFSSYPKSPTSASFSLRAFRVSSSAYSPQGPLGGDVNKNNKDKFYKELGMFSLRKRIEDSVLRAEMLAPTALELEEAKHVDQEEVIREYDLWDDLSKSNDILIKLANSAKVVETLRDLKYKAEDAKLITELAEMDAINYALFKQAYSASLDINKFLDMYEMSKLLKEPYDMEGACITIESRCGDISSERWGGELAEMYMKWAERQGHRGRIVERCPSSNGGLTSAIIELEFKFAYGFLSGESGVHYVTRSPGNKSDCPEASLASVDVVPLFIESSPELSINDDDILVSYPSNCNKTSSAVHIQHIPTGLQVQSTGERSRFANKIKALNRLKAKLLIIMRDQQIPSIESIKGHAITDTWSRETRRYVLRRSKMVQDLKSGIQLPDVNAVLNGNIDPLIAAHINSRQISTLN